MTYNDIKTKFLIIYDKDVTSSYPSLTDYEIATILDKAYLALIAQKLTGNNNRSIAFEGDIKAIEDVRPLLDTTELNKSGHANVSNELVFHINGELLYYIQSVIKVYKPVVSISGEELRYTKVTLISHADATKLYASSDNTPWIEDAYAYIEGEYIHILIDPYKYMKTGIPDPKLYLTYIQKPTSFVSTIDSWVDNNNNQPKFQLSDTMANELVNLAVIFAAETVESQRLQTKTAISKLES